MLVIKSRLCEMIDKQNRVSKANDIFIWCIFAAGGFFWAAFFFVPWADTVAWGTS